jgi:hypothetical protein
MGSMSKSKSRSISVLALFVEGSCLEYEVEICGVPTANPLATKILQYNGSTRRAPLKASNTGLTISSKKKAPPAQTRDAPTKH